MLELVLCQILHYWPVRLVVHGFWVLYWFFGFSSPGKTFSPSEEDKRSPRACQCQQDDMNEDEEELEQQYWVEALTQQLTDEDQPVC